MQENKAYQKIVTSLKRRKKGATAADVCAATALPLYVVNDLLPKAADEFSGHLRVTESGEINYYFPEGFKSRLKGAAVFLKKAAVNSVNLLKKVFTFLFKTWIMVMLIGYFLLFIALAVAAVFLQIAARSNNSDKGGKGGSIGFGLFDLIFRIWFYSSLTQPSYNRSSAYKKPKKDSNRPMHKAIFSFVFGEENPNKNWDEQTDRAVIAFLQGNRGVISLVEYMAFTGENSLDAEKSILSFCSRYEGSPEVSEEGTIVYRFEKLLLRADTNKSEELVTPVKTLKKFSFNKISMNAAFAVINSVNLIFGSYFMYQSFFTGLITDAAQFEVVSKLYGSTHIIFNFLTNNPPLYIGVILGIIPFVFSFIFWLIPAIRFFIEKKENEKIKLSNFKRFSFNKIWSSPENVTSDLLKSAPAECTLKNQAEAFDRVIKDIGAVSSPDIKISDNGKTVYSFNELKKEKQSLEKYRYSIDTSKLEIGQTIYDSGE